MSDDEARPKLTTEPNVTSIERHESCSVDFIYNHTIADSGNRRNIHLMRNLHLES